MLIRKGKDVNVGVREGSRLGILGAESRGFNSPHVHQITAPPIALTTGRACPRAEAKEQGCDTVVILAHTPEESKGQNDVPQLHDRVPQVWEDTQRSATLPLLPVPKDVFRAA
ncbi:MAG: hypothetical protein ACRECH_10705 [Nitrososphaerales archaeon]